MVKQDEDSSALTYDNQDLASQPLLDSVKEDISQKYLQWIQKLDQTNISTGINNAIQVPNNLRP